MPNLIIRIIRLGLIYMPVLRLSLPFSALYVLDPFLAVSSPLSDLDSIPTASVATNVEQNLYIRNQTLPYGRNMSPFTNTMVKSIAISIIMNYSRRDVNIAIPPLKMKSSQL